MARCWHLVQASQVGVTSNNTNTTVADSDGDSLFLKTNNNNLKIIGTYYDGRYVTVDTTTPPGIKKALRLGFTPPLSDVISTPLLWPTISTLYDKNKNNNSTKNYKALIFCLFRHPIDRAISLYYYLPSATWEQSYDPKFKNLTFEEYAMGNGVENNWMTRFLVDKRDEEEIVEEDLIIAMQIVGERFLVGLVTEMERSVERFETYFGWRKSFDRLRSCQQQLAVYGMNTGEERRRRRQKQRERIKEGSVEWELLKRQNEFDLRLYEFVVRLFKEQGETMRSLQPKKVLW